MNIKFNIPVKNKYSKINVQNLVQSEENIHGPGKNYKKIQKFLKKKFGFRSVLLTNSCTSSLEIAALSLNLKPTDEIIIPSFSFITTGSSFARTGAKIVYCDIERNTCMPSMQHITQVTSKKTKAIVILHYQGWSVSYLDKLKKYCRSNSIYLIEDAAQALGSKFKRKYLGNFGDIACFSFHQTKNLHSGLGGCIVINNKKINKKINYIYDKGTNRIDQINKKIKYYSWVCLGSSYLMSELHASYLWPQLKIIKSIINIRKKLYKHYLKKLNTIKNIEIIKNVNNYIYNYHAIVITLKNITSHYILTKLKRKKINAYICYYPLHLSKYGRRYKLNKLRNTEYVFKHSIRLPLHIYIKNKDIDYVCKQINFILSKKIN